MTIKEAADILDEFNKWRRGQGKYGWKENPSEYLVCPYSPGEIGVAIDTLVEHAREHGDQTSKTQQNA